MDVLSDDWISHPVYVSESTGFVAHKKTIYEEAMYKCEEERYEFDLNIEANLHVISILEPIAIRISSMPPEERSKLKLEPGLGGNSAAIYQRIIKKIYDPERGLEVIEALHHSPSIAVPVILKRLKQKDEEWKRSQREWKKVWKEIDLKNFSKSLDHQGIHFKAADRKAQNVKSLVTEIEVLSREQRNKRSSLANRYQFDFIFANKDSLYEDCSKIILDYIDASMSLATNEEEKMILLVKEFIPKFFLLNANSVSSPVEDKGFKPVVVANHGVDQDEEMKEDAEDKIMMSEPRVSANNGEVVGTRVDTDVPPATRKRSTYSFYANTPLYSFFRLYQVSHY
jgi:paired amphipathic helix protein Sin3a